PEKDFREHHGIAAHVFDEFFLMRVLTLKNSVIRFRPIEIDAEESKSDQHQARKGESNVAQRNSK
ncbi:MAG TPA: hypothetical protein ACQGQG_09945, partial [Xylella sp.]